MKYIKPSPLYYGLAQIVSWFVATFIFKRKVLRNEIKGVTGPYVVIANHQSAYDFVNLIGIHRRPMTFVISNSFYHSLPITGILKRMGVIPKQQFQTTIKDMKRMKAVVENGQPLVIYPAGLMCEDGLSTPIPPATYKFLKWLNVDVYVAKTSGTYFAMPKWAKGMRPGRTYLDVYKLFSKDELARLDVDAVRARAEEALLFDAYREQEDLRVKYKENNRVDGLEHVLYMCPHCHAEFSMEVKNGTTLRCAHCGYEQSCDEYAFFHNTGEVGPEVRYVSDWSRLIYHALEEKVLRGEEDGLSAETAIHMIDYDRHKYVEVGRGTVSLSAEGFRITGEIHGEPADLQISIAGIPALPFTPGKYLEVQHGERNYRCVLNEGRLVIKYVNLIKIFYALSHAAEDRREAAAR